ncbi:ribonuclease H-like domain-containing protein [Tanacetum coccineum]
MNSSYSSYHLHLPQPKSTMNSTNASSSNPSKKIKLTIIPPRQLFVNISSDEEVITTPSPTTTSSSPTPPNAPSKTPSTNQTSSSQDNTSSSFQLKLQISPSSSHKPTSPQPLNLLLENILDQHGVDFDETFSPVVQPATIRTVLSLAVSRQWPIYQLDVKNAFLNGDLSETVYMHQPPGFVDSCYPDHGSQIAYLLIYVDGIILTSSSPVLLQQIVDSLHKEFDMTYLEALNYFLGIFAVRRPTGLFLSQKNSIQGTLELGLQLYASAATSLVGYTDADWAGCPSTRRSTSGYCVFLATPVQHQRTKHIEIDIHFVRDMVKSGHVRVLHVPSRFQYADIFTKGLPSALFEDFRSSLSVQPPPAPTAGAY